MMVHADVGEKVILGCKGLVLNAASIWLLQRLAVCTVHDELDDLLENADGRIRLALVLTAQLEEMANGALELVVPSLVPIEALENGEVTSRNEATKGHEVL